ncbi:hypothetical protein [Archangium lipolyticum]|uniref:hypothetical protein n=1 Tax=Archangium lipolyticum TaxID=2970465 RepID=UPI00214A0F90|nr:hypothetical protein [Archangium lipolyticum]
MEDSAYILFFTLPPDANRELLLAELGQTSVSGLVLKHRPSETSPHRYSIQSKIDGRRFDDETVEEMIEIIRKSGGEWAGQRIFYSDEDFQ